MFMKSRLEDAVHLMAGTRTSWPEGLLSAVLLNPS